MSVRIGTSICSVETEETRAEDGILERMKKRIRMAWMKAVLQN